MKTGLYFLALLGYSFGFDLDVTGLCPQKVGKSDDSLQKYGICGVKCPKMNSYQFPNYLKACQAGCKQWKHKKYMTERCIGPSSEL